MEGGDLEMTVIRKGPWMPEEDEVLVDYVRKYGPRDWSAIRSKGLLPRTGKSCRLRWVNKLKPDLKVGCKFSPEEERIVLDLQAQFGNKWARIATYLPGRTDNDVKNFWSTRQKRLARLLRTSLPTRSSQSVKKQQVPSPQQAIALSQISIPHQVTALSLATIDEADPFLEGSSNMQWRNNSFMNFCHEPQQMVQMPPAFPGENENMLNVDTKLPFLEPEAERTARFSPNASPQELPVSPLPLAALDLPDFQIEDYDHILGIGGMYFMDDVQQPPEGPTFEFGESSKNGIKREEGDLIDNFFDDLPADMFEYLEPNENLDPKQD